MLIISSIIYIYIYTIQICEIFWTANCSICTAQMSNVGLIFLPKSIPYFFGREISLSRKGSMRCPCPHFWCFAIWRAPLIEQRFKS